MGQQPVHLPGGEGGGGAAAHVKALNVQAQVLHHLRRSGDFPQQHLQVRLHKAEALFHRLGHKAAIGAAGGAEGNADIEGDVLGMQLRLGLQPRLGRLDAQLPAGLGDAIGVPKQAVHLPGRHALLQVARRQLGRADTREGAPGGGHPRHLPGGLEEAQLHRPLAQALGGIGIRRGVPEYPGNAPLGTPVIA